MHLCWGGGHQRCTDAIIFIAPFVDILRPRRFCVIIFVNFKLTFISSEQLYIYRHHNFITNRLMIDHADPWCQIRFEAEWKPKSVCNEKRRRCCNVKRASWKLALKNAVWKVASVSLLNPGLARVIPFLGNSNSEGGHGVLSGLLTNV